MQVNGDGMSHVIDLFIKNRLFHSHPRHNIVTPVKYIVVFFVSLGTLGSENPLSAIEAYQ
jgi:hypothetical protein